MFNRFLRPALPSLILGVMLLALVGLAFLQYRWSGELSQAYEQRMQSALVAATQNLRSDFQTDLTTLSRRLQVSTADVPAGLHRLLSANARALPAASPAHILYAVQLDGLMLARYGPTAVAFTAVPWPASLAPLRAELLAHADDLANASARRRHSRPWLAASTAPVLFRAVEDLQGVSVNGFVLIELDAARYFSQLNDRLLRASGLESRLAVFVSDLIVFDSQSQSARSPANSSLDLLAPAPSAPRLNIRSASDDSSWRIAASHRPGALDAAVAAIRIRNLAAGLGVCLVLCGGIAFLVFNARRAQQFAQRQASFVAGFSHELRTPIAAVCVLAENLRDGVLNDPQQIRRYGTLLLEQGHRLRTRIEQILSFAAGQEDRLLLQAVSLADTVAEVLREDAALLTGISIESAILPGLPKAWADPAALKSCIANLLGNAAKYAKAGAWIGIVAADRSPAGLTLTISDRGPGIDPVDLAHVFEPFYRGRDARAKLVPGAGLGLHLVRRTMQSMNGRATLVSLPGQGCSVTLHLRIAPA